MRILLVEDEKLIGDGIQAGLRQRGFVVDWVTIAEDAERVLATRDRESFGGIVLDLGLPGKPGLELLRQLRRAKSPIPVLVLTARDSVTDRVTGLDAGADDYLVKPFSIDELAARLRALERRSLGRSTSSLELGELVVDPASHRVLLKGEPVAVSAREFAILKLLLENEGRVLSREKLEAQLYGWGGEIESNAVEVHVHHLRRKLGADLIRTIRGVGYMVGKAR